MHVALAQHFTFSIAFYGAVALVAFAVNIYFLYPGMEGGFSLDFVARLYTVHPRTSIKHDAFHPIQNRQSLSPGCHALVIVLYSTMNPGAGEKKNLENCQSLLRRGRFLKTMFQLYCLMNTFFFFFFPSCFVAEARV